MDLKQVITTIVAVIILMLIYYFTTIPRRKQEKELKEMRDKLKKGDKIITYSGLSGEIEEIMEDNVVVKLYPDNVRVRIEKWAVAGLDDRTLSEQDSNK